MRIKKLDRVQYTANPLVEVVAQVRFPRALEIDDRLPTELQRTIQGKYPILEVQEELISVFIGQGAGKVAGDPPSTRVIYHFISADKVWRISLTSEYVALTCVKYDQWESFSPRMIEALEAFHRCYPITHTTRIGLRYRDLVVREDLGLGNVQWRELIAPFLLGVSVADQLSEAGKIDEKDVQEAQSYIGLLLEDCALGLRYGLVRKEGTGEAAYMVDADFFYDREMEKFDRDTIERHLNGFHANAGSVFRACIQGRLHEALGPVAVS
ncbi:TIGR04255 family protein [Candidatus Accumulibacter sp. ACC012]|uniref:TIGR04255 family protein n=1 Tax=Candidatus Accumulibacter sp. ACC012 TaxID=2823332 RepID=UPI0025C56573|nr:TIGR04255 family protein [Candidatus Accumulibacter sp. ACC012]